MQTNHFKPLEFVKAALLLSALSYLFMYLYIGYCRLQYPFDLEWVEGGMVNQVQRILDGESIYVAPSIHFVPFLYPPLYFYLSAIVSTVFRGGLFPLRLVSFIASLASFILIFLIVREETKSSWAAFISIGLFTASFRLTGAWLDIARVDSLFLALWLLFIYFVRGKSSLLYAILSGIFASLAFLTKQTALITCLPVIAYLFTGNWKYALSGFVIMALIVVTTTLLLDRASAGWYSYYVFGLQSQQTEWLPWTFINFWNEDLLMHLPLATLFILFFFLNRLHRRRSVLIQWLSILAAALICAFLTRVKVGGYDNVLLPAYVVISILFGLGLNESLNAVSQLNVDYKVRVEILIHVACLIQLITLFYDPFAQIPTESDLQAGYELVSLISKVDGDVYLPDHGYITTLAGKKTYAHHSAIWDILRGNKQTKGKAILLDDLDYAIRQQIFDMIIFDSAWNYCCSELNQYYTRKGVVFEDETVFYPVTGWKRRPTHIYISKRLE